MIHHGGKLLSVAERYNRPIEDWVDLSTGISPYTYPIGPIPENVWNRLPEDNDGLVDAAQEYYGSENLLPVSGSQAAIQRLPALFERPMTVAVPEVGYKEHQHAWQQSHHIVRTYSGSPSSSLLQSIDILLLINPNNPSTERYSAKEICQFHAQMKPSAHIIVDEAFMDLTPEASLLAHFPSALPNWLIVLRSVGKFFGLAGIRLGFVFAQPHFLTKLEECLGPWTIAGPSRYIASKALADRQWQTEIRQQLTSDGHRLATLLSSRFESVASQGLFHTVYTEDAEQLHDYFAHLGILCRLCDEKDSLRFGLPTEDWQWQRLADALSESA